MGVVDFKKHKRKNKSKSTSLAASWIKSVYNPKNFRRKNKGNSQQDFEPQPTEQKVMAYIGVLVVVMVFILVYAVLKKNGLVD